MSNLRQHLFSLLFRSIPAAGLACLAWHLLSTAQGGFAAITQLLYGMSALLLAAVLIAPAIAAILAEPSGNMFFPLETAERPPPLYSVAEAKRKKGLFTEAIARYRDIAENYPQELKPYVEIMDIAIRDLKNDDLAWSAYRLGKTKLTDQDAQDALDRMYEAITSLQRHPRLTPRGPIPFSPRAGKAQGE